MGKIQNEKSKKQKKYILVFGQVRMFDNRLEEVVTKFLKEGWELQGGVSVDNGMAYQAMVKEI